jgi:uncharacterized protein with ParB-like and HNH nuclease domain
MNIKTTNHHINKNARHDKGLILKKAIFKAASLWGIKNKDLGQIIGMSEATISRLNSDKKKGIEPSNKEGELALLFIRAFRSLDAFFGNSIENEKKWLRANNKALKAIPLESMKTVTGLVSVVNYLDAIRGKI